MSVKRIEPVCLIWSAPLPVFSKKHEPNIFGLSDMTLQLKFYNSSFFDFVTKVGVNILEFAIFTAIIFSRLFKSL